MILYVPPSAPFLVKAGADLLLVGHIGGGVMGIASGFTAAFTRKGGRVHRLAGDAFVVSMLVMAAIGTAVSPFLPTPQPGNMTGGLLACYAVATGWATAKRQDGRLGRAQTMAAALPALMVPVLIAFGVIAYNAPARELAGVPFIAPFGMAVVAAIMAGSDLSAILRGALTPAQRLARHLWRMNMGLLLAVGSALGQPRITDMLPMAVRMSPLILTPVLVVLGVMIFYLVRVRLAARPKRPARAPLAAVGEPAR